MGGWPLPPSSTGPTALPSVLTAPSGSAIRTTIACDRSGGRVDMIHPSRSPNASPAVPQFEPHPWFPGPLAQTIAGVYLPGPQPRLKSQAHVVPLEDGDALLVLDSIPGGWRAG